MLFLPTGVDVTVRTGWSGGTHEVVVSGVLGFGEIVLRLTPMVIAILGCHMGQWQLLPK
jgi:hypothetical protein